MYIIGGVFDKFTFIEITLSISELSIQLSSTSGWLIFVEKSSFFSGLTWFLIVFKSKFECFHSTVEPRKTGNSCENSESIFRTISILSIARG